MKKVFCYFALLMTLPLAAKDAFAELGSDTTQLPAALQGSKVVMESGGVMRNIVLSEDHSEIIIQEPGIYFLMGAGQAGASNPGTSGYVDIWLEQNGKTVPDTNARFGINDFSSTGIVLYNVILPLKQGDILSTRFSASGPSLGLLFIQPDVEPAIPSFEMTLFKIAELNDPDTAKK